jgi:acetolactate synthase-1/2/3 large subunit
MPMVMITGQKPILSAPQAQFQVVDIVGMMQPLTKLAQRIVSTAMIPTMIRNAFRVVAEERPGAVHLERPEQSGLGIGGIPFTMHEMTEHKMVAFRR